MKSNKILSLFSVCLAIPPVALYSNGCSNQPKSINSLDIYHGEEYGGIYFKYDINKFNNVFHFGDSLNIEFTLNSSYSTKLIYEDVPYYDGYYVRSGQFSLVGYPGYKNVSFTKVNSSDIWLEHNFDGAKVTVTLNQANKYKNTQDAFSALKFSTNRDDYNSDEEFANFRPMNIGNMKTNLVFRAASPCNNRYNRRQIVNKLCQSNGITFDLNLSEDQTDLDKLVADSSFEQTAKWYKDNIYTPTKYSAKNLGIDFNAYAAGIKAALSAIINNTESEPKYLLHCVEGKDRTGVMGWIIESLVDAKYEDMVSDYWKTYENMYHVSIGKNKNLYDKVIEIKLKDAWLCPLTGLKIDDDFSKVDYNKVVKDYLMNKIGMRENEVTQLQTKLKK